MIRILALIWALTILGGVFLLAGVSMLKYRKDDPAK